MYTNYVTLKNVEFGRTKSTWKSTAYRMCMSHNNIYFVSAPIMILPSQNIYYQCPFTRYACEYSRNQSASIIALCNWIIKSHEQTANIFPFNTVPKMIHKLLAINNVNGMCWVNENSSSQTGQIKIFQLLCDHHLRRDLHHWWSY